MNQGILLLESILKRNNFSFEKEGQTVFIKKAKERTSIVKYYQIFSIVATIIGLCVFPLSILLGGIILTSTIPLYFRILSLKSKRKEEKNKVIEINDEDVIFRACLKIKKRLITN